MAAFLAAILHASAPASAFDPCRCPNPERNQLEQYFKPPRMRRHSSVRTPPRPFPRPCGRRPRWRSFARPGDGGRNIPTVSRGFPREWELGAEHFTAENNSDFLPDCGKRMTRRSWPDDTIVLICRSGAAAPCGQSSLRRGLQGTCIPSQGATVEGRSGEGSPERRPGAHSTDGKRAGRPAVVLHSGPVRNVQRSTSSAVALGAVQERLPLDLIPSAAPANASICSPPGPGTAPRR